MKFNQATTLIQLADLIGCIHIGESSQIVTGINEIHRVEYGDVVFVDHPKYYDKALNSAATVIIIDKEVDCPVGKGLLISETPFDDFNKITRHYNSHSLLADSVGENTSVASSAKIAPNVVIGHNTRIGENVILHPGVIIGNDCILEDNVEVGPNSVIGHSAFYYKKKDDGYHKMHTCGGVHLKENVEIGALCTIDSGVTAMTIVGTGSKIDNQVHIGHDTIVGSDCLFAANVGIAGCVTIQNNVTLWGQVGCASDVVIEDDVTVLAQSGISKRLKAGKTYFGSPCGEVRVKFKEMAATRKLPDIIDKL